MKTVNFICPFDSVTRLTTVPDGIDWVHLTPEKGNTVCVQVRGVEPKIQIVPLEPEKKNEKVEKK